ncbi:Uma2 family endonuclease [Streptomyces hoynatensis]|uniref:Uma2 family endonuclease n=1 Tax=Streptomyces hoynatensis TaxID=1141874 RepID=A0A3A9YP75_9ACTN|nr:Uma2 family endonuclease [Streptomyces hoynatensis]RKN36896.1 Uma2 family endonuclease [Streptomyces hoynatensis]
MTVMAAHDPLHRGTHLLDTFLGLELPDGYRAELIEGEIHVSPPPDGDHEDLVYRVIAQVVANSATRMAFSGNKGLLLAEGDHVIPDITFVPHASRLFRGAPSWMEPDGVAMVVEVTSGRPDRDETVKRRLYSLSGIPLYLLADRGRSTLTLHSVPAGEDYKGRFTVAFGEPVPLPEPFAFDLDTAEFL